MRCEEIIKRSWRRLEKKGLIAWRNNKVCITPSGQHALDFYILRTEGIPPKKKWDRRWRVVIFDVPETRRNKRLRLRQLLQQLGFFHLQHSVWVYPHDCEDVLVLIKAELQMGTNVLYMIVDSIEYDKQLRRHFSLPR